MRFGIVNPAAVVAGAVVVLVAAFGLWEGLRYPMGTALRMGPGYLPVMLSGALLALGLALIVAEARRPPAEEGTERVAWRGMVAVLASICAFALLIERFGLVPAIVVSVLVSTLADRDYTLRGALTLAAAIAFFAVLIFIWGLALPMEAVKW